MQIICPVTLADSLLQGWLAAHRPSSLVLQVGSPAEPVPQHSADSWALEEPKFGVQVGGSSRRPPLAEGEGGWRVAGLKGSFVFRFTFSLG